MSSHSEFVPWDEYSGTIQLLVLAGQINLAKREELEEQVRDLTRRVAQLESPNVFVGDTNDSVGHISRIDQTDSLYD